MLYQVPKRIRIREISYAGLKAHDATHQLPDLLIVVGENGAGKSELLDALALLVNGSTQETGERNDGVMRLARGDEIRIRAELEVTYDDAQPTIERLTRAWVRTRKPKAGREEPEIRVTEELEGSIFAPLERSLGKAPGTRDKQRHVQLLLGGYAEAWAPAEILSMPLQDRRRRLLALVPGDKVGLTAVLPGDCPAWAAPQGEHTQSDEWVSFALAAAAKRLDATQASIKQAEQTLADFGDARGGERSSETITIALARLREEWRAASERPLAAGRVARAQADLDALPLLDSTPVTPDERAELALGRVILAVEEAQIAAFEEVHRTWLRAEKEAREAYAKAAAARPEQPQALPAGNAAALAATMQRLEAQVAADKGRMEALQRRRAMLDSPEVPTCACPSCGAQVNLGAVWAREAAVIDQEIDDLLVDMDTRQGLAVAARHEHAAEVAAVEAVEAEQELGSLANRAQAAELAEEHIDLELRERRMLVDQMRAALHLEQIAERIDMDAAATERAARRAAAEARLESMKGDLAAIPEARALEVIRAEIAQAEAELEAIGAANARAQEYAAAKADADRLVGLAAELREWRRRFLEIQARIIKEATGWLEERISAQLGGDGFRLSLLTDRGAPDCRFEIAVRGKWVDARVLNPGHLHRFLAALVVVLASASSAPCRPLLIDKFEGISYGNRSPLIAAIRAAIDEGTITQAVIAGCPDLLTEEPGAQLLRLGVEP